MLVSLTAITVTLGPQKHATAPGGGLSTAPGGGLYTGPGGGLYTGACGEPYRCNWPPIARLVEELERRGMHDVAMKLRTHFRVERKVGRVR